MNQNIILELNKYLHILSKKTIFIFVCILSGSITISGQLSASTATRQIPAGSVIINMGATPQTVENGLNPYGLVYDLVVNQNIPVIWSISPTKPKDGIDFTVDGNNFRGGTFIIEKQYVSLPNVQAALNAANYDTEVIKYTALTNVNVPIYKMLTSFTKWTFDTDNGDITDDYLTRAKIPLTARQTALPSVLTPCHDLFVLPHADPKWSTHGRLYEWVRAKSTSNPNGNSGWLWSGCHAPASNDGIENMYNPADVTQRTNFLTTASGTTPSLALRSPSGTVSNWQLSYPNDSPMQFMGTVATVLDGGSGPGYTPANGQTWRSGTKIAVSDASVSPTAYELLYGYAYGDSSNGVIMYEAGHSWDGTGSSNVAAIRAFLNFVFDASSNKLPQFTEVISQANDIVITEGQTLSLNVTATGYGNTAVTYQWTQNGLSGSFSSFNTSATVYTAEHLPTGVATKKGLITIKATDPCGRINSFSYPVTIQNSNANYCVNGCNGNTFINAGDPNTLEYDNIISAYHSTIIKEADGKVKVWGEFAAAPDGTAVLSPREVIPANGYNYTGTPLKIALASNTGNTAQFAVLTTSGLYAWGATNVLLSSTIKNTQAFGAVSIGTFGVTGTKADGLPSGVSPSDVKMLFGSYQTLGLVTCDGQAWILSFGGAKYGDGASVSSANNIVWHRVKTGAGTTDFLPDVVAMRGTANAMVALTAAGKIYTWGTGTYLGDGTTSANRTYATEMILPTGITPKQIGMSIQTQEIGTGTAGVSYYVLSKAGELYSLGKNGRNQLGDFTTTERTSWVRVKKSATENMDAIVWFSPQEHDNSYAAVNALTTTSKLYAWGYNADNMLGAGTVDTGYNPIYMPGGLNANDIFLGVETGGHTSMLIKKCTSRYGYVGHRYQGSMGDGTSVDAYESTYNFVNTPPINLCGANTTPPVQNLKICSGSTANLNNAHLGTVPTGETLAWYTTSTRDSGTQVTNPLAVGPGTYYAFYEGSCPNPPASNPVIVSNYASGEPGSETCYCYKPANTSTSGTTLNTNFGITALGRAGSDNSNWPMVRKGAHIALEAKTKGFVPTRVADPVTAITNPVEGMMIYDTTLNCLRIYVVDTVTPTNTGWKCFDKQTCPDN
ncbi:RCC1 domain-containing protein [Chryseobacterium defluvii]|uniref:Ig-like domain-containing protein n=1 Tax=Chryseobacterium defluvii TaxID=160396 RepID=A0A495SNU9_9FLAO|nr:hypothetical protein [Chryseobacterium defluvii]RKT01746.1 hypothetical protein BCF58_0970 [Chryseobacterium defluvii]